MVCVRACVRACVRTCVCACVRTCVRACVRACTGRALRIVTMDTILHFINTVIIIVIIIYFSWRWYLCAWKSPYALHPLSQKFPQRCLWYASNVRLSDDDPFSSFQGRSFSASSFHASLLQAIDGVMSLALCPIYVFMYPVYWPQTALDLHGLGAPTTASGAAK